MSKKNKKKPKEQKPELTTAQKFAERRNELRRAYCYSGACIFEDHCDGWDYAPYCMAEHSMPSAFCNPPRQVNLIWKVPHEWVEYLNGTSDRKPHAFEFQKGNVIDLGIEFCGGYVFRLECHDIGKDTHHVLGSLLCCNAPTTPQQAMDVPWGKWSFDDGVFALTITLEDGGDIEMPSLDDAPAEPEDAEE